jgi:S1-C subfamily serine protease
MVSRVACLLRTPRFLLALLLVPGLWVVDRSAHAAEPRGDKKLYQKVLKSSVWVVVVKSQVGNVLQTGNGTGWVADKERGLVITNYHVVCEFQQVHVYFPAFVGGKLITDRSVYRKQLPSISGKVIARDKNRDLALIKLSQIPKGAGSLALAAASANTEETVQSLGNPVNQKDLWRFSPWKVRRVAPHLVTYEADGKPVKMTTKLVETFPFKKLPESAGKGASGGPLVNARGEVVGVTHGRISVGQQQAVVFIDVSIVRPFLENVQLKLLASRKKPPQSGNKDKGKPKPPPTKETDSSEKREQVAAARLNLAKMLEEAGKVQKAKERYQNIIADFPGTRAAKEARGLLEKLKK